MSDEIRRGGVFPATLLEDGDAKKATMREVVEASFLTGDSGWLGEYYWGLRSNNSERERKTHPHLSVCLLHPVALSDAIQSGLLVTFALLRSLWVEEI